MSLLSRIFTRRKRVYSTLEINNTDEAISVLFDHLLFLIKEYDVHYELSSRLKVFGNASKKKKREEIVSIYLEIEDFILLHRKNSLQSKSEFRESVISDYPILNEMPEFGLIFKNDTTQKITLSGFFLRDVLTKAKQILGQFHNEFLIEADKKLSLDIPLHDLNDEEFARESKRLMHYSDLLQKKMEESLGKNAMLSIYNNVYNKYFNKYYLLDSFTVIINLVPEELLVTEDVNLPSKGQLHKLLKTQISSLEEINTKLSKEVLERVEVQKELQKNERLYSTVLHNSLNANIIFNINGSVLQWNKKAQELFGVSTENTNLFELLPTHFSSHFKNTITNFSIKDIEQISSQVFEFTLVKEEKPSYYTIKTNPVYIENKILFFSIINDITKEKNSLKLIEEAKNMAERSAQVKTMFLSNMSHEIRTPLNVIKGLSELFTQDSFKGTDQEYENIEAIKFSTENLLMIVNDILDFSKIEAGKLSMQKVDFNFRELIDNIKRGFSIKAQEKGLDFNVTLDESIPKYIIGDQFRLSQILNNLLGNALKFTNKGDVSLSIKLEEHRDQKISLRFIIKDSGLGISTEKMEHIFDSFYQITTPDGKKPEGTGLGLSITKQLINLLGGTVEVNSKVNQGTTFTFNISYSESKLSETSESQIIKNKANHLLKDKHILVAEDNKLNQLFIKQLLIKWNANVTVVENGQDALNLAKKETFDLILMDIQMPIMDGLAATKAIRNLDDTTKNSIPIVACSADVFPESRLKAEKAGVNFYITKPINLNSINEILVLLTKDESNDQVP